MDSAMEQLYYWFVERPHADHFPDETARCETLFQNMPMELIDAKETLVDRARITGFREGLRLGLMLGMECGQLP